jgi:hypothetical protein
MYGISSVFDCVLDDFLTNYLSKTKILGKQGKKIFNILFYIVSIDVAEAD